MVTSANPLIAVVDDESPVRIMLGRLLRLADYRVMTFASGEEFLDSLTAQMPACVVLDVHMPGLTGLDVQCRLRANKIELPLVFITASDDPALDKAAAAAGGIRLLRKPFPNDELLSAIATALRSERGHPA